jgi:uncharacterized membrane protein (UPF0127 family)
VFLSITNETQGTPVAGAVRAVHTWKARLTGLLATPALAEGQGLWLSPCTSVHTLFMRYAIDVIFLDADGRVLHCVTLAPWRLSRWVPKAAGVLELAAGAAQKTRLRVGDRLLFKEQP